MPHQLDRPNWVVADPITAVGADLESVLGLLRATVGHWLNGLVHVGASVRTPL